MSVLILKELRGLRAYLWLIVGIAAVFIALELATKFPDQTPLTIEGLLKGSNGFSTLVFALMIGTTLLNREADDGTLSFLDALPVSRSRIFFAKVISGFLVLLLLPLFDDGYDVLTGLLARTSTDAAIPWRFLGVFAATHVFVTLYGLSIALCLAILRQWLVLISGLIMWAFVWLNGQDASWHDWLTPKSLFSGLGAPGTPIPWGQIRLQCAVSAAALFFAWIYFCRIAVRTQDSMEALRGHRFGRMLLTIGRFSAPVVWFVAIAMAVRGFDNDKGSSSKRPLGEEAFAKHVVANYEFLFRESQREQAKELFNAADDIFRSVNEHLNAEAKERIVVDLATSIPSHTAAVATWTKIRYPLLPDTDLKEFKHILAHETTHVLLSQLGGRSFKIDSGASTQFFDEGFADYVGKQVCGDEELIRQRDRLTAAMTLRGRIPFEVLCNNRYLDENRDPTIVYVLGSIFSRALIEVGGKDAPARVVREFNRADLGAQLGGHVLWRAILQGCGLNLDGVIAAYDAKIDQIVKQEAEFAAKIPRLTAKIEVKPQEVIITPQYDGNAPGIVICELSRPSSFGNTYGGYRADCDGIIRIPRKDLKGKEFRYLLGWRMEDLYWPVYEPWGKAILN